MRGPLSDRDAVTRKGLQLGKWCFFIVNRTQENRKNTGLILVVPDDGLLQLNAIAELGGHEVRTDEQKDELIMFEVIHDLWQPFCAWTDITLIVVANQLLVAQVGQMIGQFLSQELIFG